MTPISITIERFGSITELQTFEFPQRPGLYFLSGKNGSGKSTLWHALTWCLYGRNAKGLKAGDVANWKEPKGARVAFTFTSDGEYVYSVERTHSPNTWKLYYGSEDDPGGVEDLAQGPVGLKEGIYPLHDRLKLDYEMWLNTVLLAQDEPMFLDLKPEAKSALFAEVMGLSKWDTYSQNASKKSAAQDAISRKLEAEAARFAGILEGLEGVAGELPEKVSEWDTRRKELRALITRQYAELLDMRPVLAKKFVAAETESAVCQIERQAKLKQQSEAVEPFETAQEHRRSIDKQFAVADAEQSRLLDVLDSMDDKAECPTCGSKLPKHTIQKVTNERTVACGEAERLALVLEDAIEAENKARDRLTEARNGAEKALSALDLASDTLKRCRHALEANTESLDALDDQVDKLDKETNPYAKQAASAADDRERVRTQHADVVRDLGESTERAALLGFWVRGFKDVRLGLIAEALDQLALEVASCLSALGLSGWGLTFEVDRVTKSGSVSRGFNVFVQGPGNDRQVPWESWSGGEAQRLRIAAQCGLANLIRSSTGASIALEVWDEPSSGVEAQGIADLLEALRTRAEAEKRQIWVTDHHALGSAAFDGTVLVKKGRKGTEYEVMQ